MSCPSSVIVPLDARAGDGVVHAVQAAQERRLAAPRRADHGQHLIASDIEAHVLHGVLVAVVHIDVARAHHRVVDRIASIRDPAARRRCRIGEILAQRFIHSCHDAFVLLNRSGR